jgi:hypothetical protein
MEVTVTGKQGFFDGAGGNNFSDFSFRQQAMLLSDRFSKSAQSLFGQNYQSTGRYDRWRNADGTLGDGPKLAMAVPATIMSLTGVTAAGYAYAGGQAALSYGVLGSGTINAYGIVSGVNTLSGGRLGINTHVDAGGTALGIGEAVYGLQPKFAPTWPLGAAITIGTGAASIYYSYGK